MICKSEARRSRAAAMNASSWGVLIFRTIAASVRPFCQGSWCRRLDLKILPRRNRDRAHGPAPENFALAERVQGPTDIGPVAATPPRARARARALPARTSELW